MGEVDVCGAVMFSIDGAVVLISMAPYAATLFLVIADQTTTSTPFWQLGW
jgi:hypothetical protein